MTNQELIQQKIENEAIEDLKEELTDDERCDYYWDRFFKYNEQI